MKLLHWNIVTIILSFPGGHLFQERLFHEEYDYIVVGAGSTGATVASRLAEDNDIKVLLLEAGGYPPPNTEIPYIFDTFFKTKLDWQYYTEPQKNGKIIYWARGKTLGGSSSINGMIYCRGNKRDYDNWAQQGCKAWSYEDVLPYFIKSEGNQISDIRNNGYHGSNGSLTVSYPPYSTPLRKTFIEAGKELGHQEVEYNGAQQTGFAKTQFTERNGSRCSTEKAFLRPHKPNLDILINAFVTKVKFDDDKRARYVEFEINNTTETVAAREEIIISAGFISSPQILMLSGIGPKKHLGEFKIPVVADIPGVGQNLHDHVKVLGLYFTLNASISLRKSRVLTEANKKLFTTQGKGPLTVPGAVEGIAFVKTKFSDSNDDFPDIELFETSRAPFLSNLNKSEMEKLSKMEISTVQPMLLRPKSRGWIKLRSSDPHEYPILDPQYLTENIDKQVLTEGLRIALQLFKTKSYQKYGNDFYTNAFPPECGTFTKWSDDYLTCFVQAMFQQGSHQVGTCKMGDPRDSTTVVDHELRVKGVTGLRVADASVMPTVISGNINAPCIMIGEKVADMIKKSRRNSAT